MKRESWLQAAPESATIARALVREAAGEIGLDEGSAWDLMLATTEAVANAVLHGTPCSGNQILLRLESCNDGLCVEVCDCGEFDTQIGSRAVDDTGGRGIPIITAVVDTFELIPDTCQTRVRFGKRSAYAAA